MPATNVRLDNAVLNGVVNPNGLATNAWFEWGIDNAALTGRSPDFQKGSGTIDNQVVFTATGLQQKTTYYFRIAAINSEGKEAKGEIRSFSTLPLPTVTTGGPTEITINSAKLNGEVNPNGLQTRVWFEWGTDNNLVGYSATIDQPIGNGVINQPINATIPVGGGVTYYYRIAAGNPEGESRGEIVHFRGKILPVTTTTAATSITGIRADLNGTVNPNGVETYAWFEYGTDSSLTNPSITDNQLVGYQSTPQPIVSNLSGLTPHTTWYFRAVALNDAGTQKGAILSFLTDGIYVAVGDSITWGTGDDIPGDGFGYEPILQNLLTASRGYPIAVANEGEPGVSSDYGAAFIGDTLSRYPTAKYFLVLYGTNDAFTDNGLIEPVSRGTFKSNMQTIISAILGAGKTPCLAKVPFTTNSRYSDTSIQEYNVVIDELVAENGITVSPTDFYTLFLNNTGLLDPDGLHPNGMGYQSMANLWTTDLTAP
jgi:lysophospholipase L1-like esterase